MNLCSDFIENSSIDFLMLILSQISVNPFKIQTPSAEDNRQTLTMNQA